MTIPVATRLPGGWTAPIKRDVRIISAGTSTVSLVESEWGTIIGCHSNSCVVTLMPMTAGHSLTFVVLSGATLSPAAQAVVQVKANTAQSNTFIGQTITATTVSLTCQSAAASTAGASLLITGLTGTQALVQTFGTWV